MNTLKESYFTNSVHCHVIQSVCPLIDFFKCFLTEFRGLEAQRVVNPLQQTVFVIVGFNEIWFKFCFVCVKTCKLDIWSIFLSLKQKQKGYFYFSRKIKCIFSESADYS